MHRGHRAFRILNRQDARDAKNRRLLVSTQRFQLSEAMGSDLVIGGGGGGDAPAFNFWRLLP
jgi:hypothetical protein